MKTLLWWKLPTDGCWFEIQPDIWRFKHYWIVVNFGLEILVILENSWFNYIDDQRKSLKNETPYLKVFLIFSHVAVRRRMCRLICHFVVLMQPRQCMFFGK